MLLLLLGFSVSLIELFGGKQSGVSSQTVDPSWPTPRLVQKVLLYSDSYLLNASQGGTCNFGNTFGLQGIVIAANTAMYSYDVSKYYHHSSVITKSDGCGVCYNVSGPGGWGIGIVADICDDEAYCTQYPPDGYSFNLQASKSTPINLWHQVVGNTSLGTIVNPTGVRIQAVSCPLPLFHNTGVALRWQLYSCCKSLNSGLEQNGAMEWTVVNHRVRILKFEVRNADGKDFVSLTRSWTNSFSAHYEGGSDGGDKWWVFNQNYTIRITSATDTITWLLDPQLMIDKKTGKKVLELGVSDTLPEKCYSGEVSITPTRQFIDYNSNNNSIPKPSIILVMGILVFVGIFSRCERW